MYARVKESNKCDADLHVPIHTNAFNKNVTGTRIFCWNKTGDGYKASKAVYNALAPLTPGTSESISVNSSLYEIKYPYAPSVYIEVDFHDVAKIAQWIIAHVQDIGEAICKGICDYFGVKYVAPAPAVDTSVAKPCNVNLRVLSKGMSGDDVRAAMLLLKDKGFYTATIPASDDVFGDKMLAATKALQKAKNIDVDGVIGADTWKMLLSK